MERAELRLCAGPEHPDRRDRGGQDAARPRARSAARRPRPQRNRPGGRGRGLRRGRVLAAAGRRPGDRPHPRRGGRARAGSPRVARRPHPSLRLRPLGHAGRSARARQPDAGVLRSARASQADAGRGAAGHPRRLLRAGGSSRCATGSAARYERVRGVRERVEELHGLAGARDRELDLLALRAPGDRGGRPERAGEPGADRASAIACAISRPLRGAAAAGAEAISPEEGDGVAASCSPGGVAARARRRGRSRAAGARRAAARRCATRPRTSAPSCAAYLLGIEAAPGRLERGRGAPGPVLPPGAQARRHDRGCLAHAERCRARRDELEHADVALEEAEHELAQAEAELERLAEELSAGRAAAAPELAAAVRQRLSELAMAEARFEVEVEPRPDGCGPRGADAVELLIAAEPGLPAGPLREVASGGELSRVMLALLSVAHGERGGSAGSRSAARLRRDRRRHRRSYRPRGRRAPAQARRRAVRSSASPTCPRSPRSATRHFTIAKSTGVSPRADDRHRDRRRRGGRRAGADARRQRGRPRRQPARAPAAPRGLSAAGSRPLASVPCLGIDTIEPKDQLMAEAETRFIFITGGVVSSLGKGIAAASIGRLLVVARTRRPAAEVRSVHQCRPGNDVAVPARRGVRDRGRRGDRPRSRPLRALHRRQHQPRLERHRRRDLQHGDPPRASRRLPRRDRAGRPAHHRRDQAADPPDGRLQRRRLRDHRDRRHRRRHRVAAVPRGDPSVPGRRRAAAVHVHPPDAGALHRPRRRAQDQADAALGQRAAAHRYRARHGRVPLGVACSRPTSARRSRCSPASRPRPSSRPTTSPTSTRCRWCSTHEGVDDFILARALRDRGPRAGSDRLGADHRAGQRAEPDRRASRWSASTSSSRTPTCRWPSRSGTPACTTAARSRSTGSTRRSVGEPEVAAPLAQADGILIPGGFGGRGFEGKIRAAQIAREHGSPTSASAWACTWRSASSRATWPAWRAPTRPRWTRRRRSR